MLKKALNEQESCLGQGGRIHVSTFTGRPSQVLQTAKDGQVSSGPSHPSVEDEALALIQEIFVDFVLSNIQSIGLAQSDLKCSYLSQ